jgi:hypothetical protein
MDSWRGEGPSGLARQIASGPTIAHRPVGRLAMTAVAREGLGRAHLTPGLLRG